jgi:coatomer protein complex subunit gamma
MVMQPEIDGLVQVAEVPADVLEYNVPGVIYVAFEQEDPEELANGKKKEILYFMCTLLIPIQFLSPIHFVSL